MALGIAGACRREELCNLTVNDIEDHGSSLALIKIPKTKTNKPRSFAVTSEIHSLFQKYRLLRPVNCKTDRFFLNYQNGKCTNQPIGINKFSKMPREIATVLKLPNPEKYTGHSFRRTSATLLADAGADITTLKRHGGWQSNTVAEGYIADSVQNKVKIGKQILQNINVIDIAVSSESSTVNQSNIKLNCNPAKKAKIVSEKNEDCNEEKPIDFDSPSTSRMPDKENCLLKQLMGTEHTMNFTNCSFNFNLDNK